MTSTEYRALKPNHKFNAKRTERDGIKFPSKAEARCYDRLVWQQQYGDIVGFLRQPSFDLGGGTTYRADFQVFHIDGTVEFIEVKGHETDAFKKAKRQVESRYPWLKITVVK